MTTWATLQFRSKVLAQAVNMASDATQRRSCDPASPVDPSAGIATNGSPQDSVLGYRFALAVTGLLLVSGLFHLLKFFWDAADWSGPTSIRKPSLFGISSGLTTWSITWLMTQLRPRRYDRILLNALALGLFIEVALITLQYWRTAPSHFNRATSLDAAIESLMLVLILAVTAILFYLTLRSSQLRPVATAMAVAIRGGMALLTLSCGLGVATWLLGEWNLANGRPYETWKSAGVLKFPHGVALHAIQLLPVAAWLSARLNNSQGARIVQSLLGSQVLLLLFALWQTIQGRSRFDCDALGGCMLGGSILLFGFSIVLLCRRP